MKLGFSSAWKNEEHLRKTLPVIQEAGFQGIEPTFLQGCIPSPEGYHTEARLIRNLAETYSLEIPSMRGGRVFWHTVAHAQAQQRMLALDHTKRALEALAVMGGDVLLVVPGQRQHDIPYHRHWERAVEFARRAGEEASKHHMTIALENTEAGFPASLWDWKKFLHDINHPCVGMYLDAGNIIWQDLGDPSQWIRELSPWVRRIHFKDAVRGERLVLLLEGEMNWPEVMGTVRSIGWDNWLTVEPDWYRWAPEVVPVHVMTSLKAILELEV